MYKEKPLTIPDICRVIADKIATINVELCQKVCRSVAARLVSCIERNGQQFELSKSVVPNRFVSADRSTFDNSTAAHQKRGENADCF